MTDPLHHTLSYRDCLPLTWQPLAEALPAEHLQALKDQNLRVLSVVASLEERHRIPHDASEPVLQELERLHQKLDMMMVLFGQFLRRLDPPAPSVSLRLSGRGASWRPAAALDAGLGLLTLHRHPCMPEPLVWTAHLGHHGDEVCALFEPCGEALEAALERHVFLHHRRSVAGSRPAAA